jgi:PAS domain S-box-containing protein
MISGSDIAIDNARLFDEARRARTESDAIAERLRLAQQAAKVGSFDWNIKTGANHWTPELESMYGLAPGAFPGTQTAWEQLVHPEDRRAVRRCVAEAMKTGQFECEWRVIRPDGSIHWLLGRASVVRNAIGEAERLVGVNIDVSERKEAERTGTLLAAIVDSSDDAIISKNLNGIITSWNKSAERMFGYSAEEAVGQEIILVIPEDRRQEEVQIIERLKRGERVDHFQTVRRRKDGTLFDVSLTISPMTDSSGRVIGASKVARDITSQRQVERALRESEQRLRMITDASPIMIWMSGTDKLCFYFNKGWLDFTGRSLEEETGNGWTDNVHPEDFDRCLAIYTTRFDARQPFEMEYRLRHHAGQFRWILDRAVPRFTADGVFEGYVGACLDIDDTRQAAEKVRMAGDSLRLMKIQDEERRRIARELHDSAGQTLAILGMNLAQLVHRAQEISPRLADEGKEIEELVQQLSREIRTTSYLLHPPLLDEVGLVSALKLYVDGLAQRSGIAVTLDAAEELRRLPGDIELAVFRSVQECLTNIHRHAGSSTAAVRISIVEDVLYVKVSDQGKGISGERLEEIRSGRSGVGIRGIRERLRQFGGELRIEPTNPGTCVTASFSIRQQPISESDRELI